VSVSAGRPDALDPAAGKGIRVVVTDLATGDGESVTIWNDYNLVTAGSCYVAHVQATPTAPT
jgi:hypothetical protein